MHPRLAEVVILVNVLDADDQRIAWPTVAH
jgi:hypothetical protein